MATVPAFAPRRSSRFQFRLATLLIAMTWIGLVCVALRTPTRFWSGTIMAIALFSLLANVLVVIYRTDATRAFAIGFIVFAGGYAACVLLMDRSLGRFDPDSTLPTTRVANWAFHRLHSGNTRPMTVSNFGGGFGSGMSGMGGYGGFAPAGGGAGPGPTIIQVSLYDGQRFVEVVQCACLTLLGALGGIMAQWLFLTRREEA